MQFLIDRRAKIIPTLFDKKIWKKQHQTKSSHTLSCDWYLDTLVQHPFISFNAQWDVALW